MAVNPAPVAVSRPAAQNMPALRRVLATIRADSCPRSFNFHMHTVHSDGQLQPEDLIEQAIAIGLKGLAITDHHSVSGYRAAQQYLDDWKWRSSSVRGASTNACQSVPYLWTGVEINANLLGIEVHILGYAFDPTHPCLQPYLQHRAVQGNAYQAANAIGAIQKAGGLAVLAHPARYRRSPVELIQAAVHLGIDGVEAYYAYNNPNPWKPSPDQTQQVQTLADSYKLLRTCGTDTHGLNLLQRL
uniref:PHP domain-containing protein n=1 Tax=Trichocoleus desertorum TaxID=1481672 RepID=UPI0025B2D8A5